MAEEFLRLSVKDRKDALGVAATKIGRAPHILEKDVLVVWALDAVTSAPFGGDIVFKGGTSLSKIYGAIRRFSEDLDLTYDVRAFAKDLVDVNGRPLATTKGQVGRWTDKIKARLKQWTMETALPVIQEKARGTGLNAKIQALDDTIVIGYEPIFVGTGYLPPTIRLEFGARSTGEPNDLHTVACDVMEHVSDVVFPSAKCRVMKIERTFWEKATAIHVCCMQQRIRQERFSRHWSDLAQLDEAGTAATAIAAREIAASVGADKNILFREKSAAGNEIDYLAAIKGELRLIPDGEAREHLAADYGKMIEDGYFPAKPMDFEELMARCLMIQERANAAQVG